jgi:DNA-binding transcriptional regulator PaaX
MAELCHYHWKGYGNAGQCVRIMNCNESPILPCLQLKLERALEMKDGQLESFTTVATRQIKMLEERCRELTNWDVPGGVKV